MDLFKSLPLKKQEYMNRLFRNCTEEVKYYMSVIDVEADQTFNQSRRRMQVHIHHFIRESNRSRMADAREILFL